MKDIMRPGHADLVAHLKTNGTNDYRGGGKFSGRLTAPLVFMGAICKQLLMERKIYIGSSINRIGLISNKIYQGLIRYDEILTLNKMTFPCLDNNLVNQYEKFIIEAAKNKDSVGGMVTTYVIGVPVGLGDAYFDGVESYLSYLIYGIPAVKGVSFGFGESFSKTLGSCVSDVMYYDDKKEIKYKSNLNGGINGGITNGAPIVINTTIKPTPTIGIVQETINIKTKENVEVSFEGRHDPCIVQRAYVVVESMVAFGILDLLLSEGK
jgi:chorismate synthase